MHIRTVIRFAGLNARVAFKKSTLGGASGLALVAALVIAAGSAQAQSTSDSGTLKQAAISKDLEEVVVTARRTSEALSKVPVSISAFDADALSAHSVTHEQELAELVPGLTIQTGQNANQFNYALRGQTLDAFSGSSPAVLPYLNEVPYSNGAASSFYDFSSIQVLKGPQGTLFGRNASGGAVLYSSTQPGDVYGGYVTVKLGDYDMREIQAAVDLPIVPGKLTIRIAGDSTQQTGYVTNIRDGSHLGDVNNNSGRITTVFTPTANLKNVTVFQYGTSGGSELNGGMYSYYPCGSTNNGFPLTTTLGCVYGSHNGPPGPGSWPGGPTGYLNFQLTHPYQEWLSYDMGHKSDSLLASNTTTYDLTPDLTLKNIASLSKTFSRTPGILSGSPFGAIDLFDPLAPVGGEQGAPGGETFHNDTWTEEFQVQGKAVDQKLKYILGVFASSSIESDTIPVTVGPEFTPPLASITYNSKDHDVSKAVYAQTTYDLSQFLTGLSATAGGRWTWENVSLKPTNGDLFSFAKQTAFEHAPSWTLGLEYQITPENLIYFANRGSWRAGNYNGTTSPAGAANYFGNEYTHDFEVGDKYKGRIFDKSFRVDVAAYEQIVDDVQRAVYLVLGGNPAGFTHNVPKATIQGIELDGEIKLAPWLSVGGAGAYTFADYTGPNVSLFGQSVVFDSYPFTPRFSGSVFGEVTLPTPVALGPMTVRADAYYQSGQFFASLNSTVDPGVYLHGYATVNLRYDWHNVGGSNASLAMFVKNVMNRVYYQSGYVEGGSGGFNTAEPGAPRMIGGEVNYTF